MCLILTMFSLLFGTTICFDEAGAVVVPVGVGNRKFKSVTLYTQLYFFPLSTLYVVS